MSVSATLAAAEKVNSFIKKRGHGVGLRLGVKTSGCSGLAYKIEFVDMPNLDDLVFDSSGIKIFVDPVSVAYLDGMILDYAKEGLQEGFKFINPNVKDECGCGKSFTV